MDFRDGLSADLPAPRDDEPGGLRDDILDELADHLACAYRRELLRGSDAATARQRVLERFGDPAGLARRLWFDAMRGKIMSQRILVVCCIVLTVISLSLGFVLWNHSVAMQSLVLAERAASEEAKRQAEEARHRAEAAQHEMIMQLQAISKSASSSKTPEWIPVSFKLTLDKLDGPPAVGVQARLGRGKQGADKEDAIERESDDKGMIDFGVVQPGDWSFVLTRPAKDGGRWLTTAKLSVVPGSAIQKAIVCPTFDEPTAPVSVRIDWPPDLADKGLAVVAGLGHEGFTYQPPLHWNEIHDNESADNSGVFHLFCGPGAGRVVAVKRGGPVLWQLSENPAVPGAAAPGARAVGVEPYKTGQIYVDMALQPATSDHTSVPLLHGRNRLLKLAIVRPRKQLADATAAERCELLALLSFFSGPVHVQIIELSQPPESAVSFFGVAGPFMLRDFQAVSTSSPSPSFDVEKDQPNVWTIHLPDELTQAVREKLKGETKN